MLSSQYPIVGGTGIKQDGAVWEARCYNDSVLFWLLILHNLEAESLYEHTAFTRQDNWLSGRAGG